VISSQSSRCDMDTLLQDLRYGVRTLLSKPLFSAAAVLSISLGIGANTAIFSVVNSLLLKSLPYPDPDRLVLVWGVETDTRLNNRSQVSATDVADYRAQSTAFEDITTYGNWSASFTGQGEPERINGMQVGDGYFGIMGGVPLLGRTFSPEDQVDGKDFVIVLGYGLWQRRFGGDPSVVGRQVSLSGRPYTVVGVMPKSFAPLPASLVDYRAEFYRPVAEKYDDQERSSRHLRAIGRLRPGISLQQAQQEMTAIAGRIGQQHPATDSNYGIRLVTIGEDTVGGLRPSLLMLFGAVGFVLLIACANVANMLVARATGRRREIAVRAALGAAAPRLMRQFLTESVVLASAGGAVGLGLALAGTRMIEALGSRVFPQIGTIALDARVAGFTLAVTVLTGIVFGLGPALSAARLDVNTALKEAGRSGSGLSRSPLRSALVVSEVAMSVVLLAGAGLLIKSVARLRDLNPGFKSAGVLTMDLSLPSARYSEPPAQAGFYKRLDEALGALPGVESAGFVSVLPLGKNFDGRALVIEDHPRPRGQEISADMYVVTPGYLRAMQIRLLNGRMLSEQDNAGALPAALIDERMARELWPDQDPLGKRIRFPGLEGQAPTWRSIVGVVGSVKQYGLDSEGHMQFYLPEDQFPIQSGSLAVRCHANPASVAGAVREAIRGLDRELPVYNVETMDDLLSDSISLRRLSMILLSVFAIVALTLAATGIYSVISYSVSQRTQEIGVRMALGASRWDVVRLVLAAGMAPATAGCAAGVAAAVVLTRFMTALLFQVSPDDPATFGLIIAVLGVVALIACYVPARRAIRTDPMIALRYE
jgi:putative ABC transport system permease protein